jgi:hypothetical protein
MDLHSWFRSNHLYDEKELKEVNKMKWDASTEKLIVAAGMALTAYSALQPLLFKTTPLPAFFTNEIIAGASIVTLGAIATAYGVVMLFTKY